MAKLQYTYTTIYKQDALQQVNMHPGNLCYNGDMEV